MVMLSVKDIIEKEKWSLLIRLMIVDKLENLCKYVALNPLFAKVVDYINNTDIYNHEVGREYICGNDVFANFDHSACKTRAEAKYESHNRMIDIQIPLSGSEMMGYIPRADLPEVYYNDDKDISFYDAEVKNLISVSKGMFVIFFPTDAHAPLISDLKDIYKVIFKVKA
ncbi:MAG: YhcH/YjgK/YiaL family protein [Bacteroidaceae bacterium]|nr:YhcH/YjgK/YiaL family protein [Bacteroidaceae bacterium]